MMLILIALAWAIGLCADYLTGRAQNLNEWARKAISSAVFFIALICLLLLFKKFRCFERKKALAEFTISQLKITREHND